MPGAVRGTAGRGTECSGLAAKVGVGHRMDSLNPEVFSLRGWAALPKAARGSFCTGPAPPRSGGAAARQGLRAAPRPVPALPRSSGRVGSSAVALPARCRLQSPAAGALRLRPRLQRRFQRARAGRRRCCCRRAQVELPPLRLPALPATGAAAPSGSPGGRSGLFPAFGKLPSLSQRHGGALALPGCRVPAKGALTALRKWTGQIKTAKGSRVDRKRGRGPSPITVSDTTDGTWRY